ncbi:aldo/keto reductase [Pisciglobus halotolerans]|uniref:Aldo/keto reductase n=1 Tax=Pisciglobus halotolerans TaxID=745365 RepID=A0A1I3DD52_9LACT|nr:aldo/keto reductase [Pisciglobus halotolerans]SFH84566.1 Aldo/keto reductase [Pisciglobus halotolerans]
MMKEHTFEFHNGVEIPNIGFGTWQIPNEEAYEAVTMALKNGYTHIDTANGYHNEENVGKAVRAFDLPREDIFVTSKLPASIKGYDETLESFEETLSNLGMDYLDLYLIHAPWPWDEKGKDCTEGNIQSWKAMEKLYRDGKIRAIGVSNFSISDIQALIESCDIVPMANQIPFYIGRDQDELLAFCKKQDIVVEAYSPLATGEILNSPEIKEIAERTGVTPAQLCIRYCLEHETLPLPKSTHEERIIENKKIDFTISPEDMQRLDAIEDIRKK